MPPSATPKLIVVIVVGTLAVISIIGSISLGLTMFFKSYLDPTILNVFSNITIAAFSALTGVLANTRQPSPANGQTSTATVSTTTSTDPIEVQPVVNKPNA